jgi:long-chain acyl-CoA synthetase
MVRRLAQFVEASGWEPSGLRTILYAGGPMYLADIRHALRVMGDKFVQIYGQGESPMTITALARRYFADREHPRYLQRLASVGVAETAVEIRVVDEHGSMVAPGVQGEILVRGETVMKGYWRNPEATAQALRDGWLHTGDVGSLDEDGFLTLTDRIKDLIISGGSNIYPREIEDVLLNHPLVSAVAVVGRPHPDWGEEVVAFVQARSGFTVSAQQLDALCLGSLARYKRPRQYFFVDELPQGGNGKVLKAQLRQRLAHSARDSSRN